MWRRGGNDDSSDGRSLAVVVPCAGRGVRGRVLSLVSVYGPVSGSGFDVDRRVMFDELSSLLSKLPASIGLGLLVVISMLRLDLGELEKRKFWVGLVMVDEHEVATN